jgi:outer membrane protein assembly factor BamB
MSDTLNAQIGARLWSVSTGYPSVGTPAIAYGNVYVDAYAFSNGGKISAYDAATGDIQWNGGDYFVPGDVTVADGAIFEAVNSGEGHFHYSDVYALDANTGQFQWQDDKQYGLEGTPPAVVNGVFYAGCSGTIELCAFDAATGVLRWHGAIPEMLSCSRLPSRTGWSTSALHSSSITITAST